MLARKRFTPVYSEEVDEFIAGLLEPCRKKLLARIQLASHIGNNDPQAFKKLDKDIWEFRANCKVGQVRLLAFWDKRDKTATLVICCRGFVKKQSKVPDGELKRAIRLRKAYFN